MGRRLSVQVRRAGTGFPREGAASVGLAVRHRAQLGGHFLDENGQAPERCHFAYSGSQGEWKGVTLAPGEALDLPVSFGHHDAPEPGSYGIKAILVSLNLRSPKGTLEIVADPVPAAIRVPAPTQKSAALLEEGQAGP